MPPPADAVAPVGWPAQVRPPGVPGWEDSAVAWLLDLCPPDYRGHTVVRRHPVVLARFAHWHVDAGVHGALTALREARADLSGLVPPGAVTAAVQTARAEHDRLVQRQRELVLVEEALRGRRYSARL